MVHSVREPQRLTHRRRLDLPVVVVLSVLLVTAMAGARATAAWGAAFQRGDVFLTGSAGIQEYSPTGQPVQTIPGTSAAITMCFDPSGEHLIVPGVGLFDSSGNPLPSNWGSVSWLPIKDGGIDCLPDARGNVYGFTAAGVITKYDLEGNALQTITVPFAGSQMSMDLAPDECTMYYAEWQGIRNTMGPFNVCTNTQEAVNNWQADSWQLVDDLRVLANGDVLLQGDSAARLVDPTGQQLELDSQSGGLNIRSMSLDPDGTSFWMCCGVNNADPSFPNDVFRYDINSGQLLSAWPATTGRIAVYSPPLLGDANVERMADSAPAGTAEAFPTTAGFSGQLTRLRLWVDSTSSATHAVIGIYSDFHGIPGALQAQATISSLTAGAWNYVDVPSASVVAGQRYLIAVLAPRGAGKLRFRDGVGRGIPSQASLLHGLTTLPRLWLGLPRRQGARALSAYGS